MRRFVAHIKSVFGEGTSRLGASAVEIFCSFCHFVLRDGRRCGSLPNDDLRRNFDESEVDVFVSSYRDFGCGRRWSVFIFNFTRDNVGNEHDIC